MRGGSGIFSIRKPGDDSGTIKKGRSAPGKAHEIWKLVGGGGGSRTRVRKKSLEASTCLAGVLISPEETSTDRIPPD